MIKLRKLFSAVVLLVLCNNIYAQVSQQIIDLKTRNDVTMRVLLLKHSNAKASLIFFAGGHGGLRIFPNGSMQWGDNNFLIRSRSIFAELGVNVAIVDAPSDRLKSPFLTGFRNTEEHSKDIEQLIIWLKQNYENIPVWLVGTSRGTESAAAVGIKLQNIENLNGIVLTSSILTGDNGNPVPSMAIENFKKPILIVHHEKDSCRVTKYSDLNKLTNIVGDKKQNQIIVFTDGVDQGDPCQAMSYHGFNGIEKNVATQIVNWILK
jgi:hypothetical protein